MLSRVVVVGYLALCLIAETGYPDDGGAKPTPVPSVTSRSNSKSDHQESPAEKLGAEETLEQMMRKDAGRKLQIAFFEPFDATVTLDSIKPGEYDPGPMVVPFRYNFLYGTAHRLKITGLPGRSGVELHALVEITPPSPRTRSYLERKAVPVALTKEDVDVVFGGKRLTKVVYLPNEDSHGKEPEPQTLVSGHLATGKDPILDGNRLGTILVVLRIGPGGVPPRDADKRD